MDLKKKLENYWYYYKYHTLFAIFAMIVVIIIISSCLRSKEDAVFTLVDNSNYVFTEHGNAILEGFAEYSGTDRKEMNFSYSTEFADVEEQIAEAANIKEFEDYVAEGRISAIITPRLGEYSPELVGSIEEVLPQDIINTLKEKNLIVYYIQEDENGQKVETDVICGILINDSKVIQDIVGEADINLVLQIPSSVNEKENAVMFVKYLFDL